MAEYRLMPSPFSAGAILDRNKSLYGAGFSSMENLQGDGIDYGSLFTRVGNSSFKGVFPPLNHYGVDVLTESGMTHINTHGAIPLGKDTLLCIGVDWTLTQTVPADGLAVFRVNRNTSDDTISSVSLVKLIQHQNDARTPQANEKPFRDEKFFSFTSMGRLWFVDAWVDYSIGTRRHIGLFNVESYKYLDLKDKTYVIEKITAGRDAVDAAGYDVNGPLLTDLGLFRF